MCLKTFFSRTPKIPKTFIHGDELKAKIEALGLTLPMGMSDSDNYYTDIESWVLAYPYLTYNAGLAPGFDCEDYAFKAFVDAQEKFGLNVGVCYGNTPWGYHAFNIIYTGNKLMLFEPNRGFKSQGVYGIFDIGVFGYQPEKVII